MNLRHTLHNHCSGFDFHVAKSNDFSELVRTIGARWCPARLATKADPAAPGSPRGPSPNGAPPLLAAEAPHRIYGSRASGREQCARK
jgi:hypothetical protein